MDARTNEDGTDHWTLLPERAQILHIIDIEPQEIGPADGARSSTTTAESRSGSGGVDPVARAGSAVEARPTQSAR